MKKSILLITLLLATASALADDNQNLGLILKVGTSVDDRDPEHGGQTTAVVLSVMTDNCQHCISPFFIHLDSTNFEGRNMNEGLGVDYVYKFQHPSSDGYYISAGAAAFTETLNHADADRYGYHAGIGMEAAGLVLSADVYNNHAVHAPLYIISAGWHF